MRVMQYRALQKPSCAITTAQTRRLQRQEGPKDEAKLLPSKLLILTCVLFFINTPEDDNNNDDNAAAAVPPPVDTDAPHSFTLLAA